MISVLRKAGSWRRIVGNQETLCPVGRHLLFWQRHGSLDVSVNRALALSTSGSKVAGGNVIASFSP
jgi:hypothetical protein